MNLRIMFEQIGRFLFRYRALVAVPFYIMLVLLGEYPALSYFPAILVIGGMIMRLWAAGYIGENARKKEFKTGYRIIDGPYRILKHPLYLGNLLLVTGVTIVYSPPLWFFIIIITAFFIIYSLIIISETVYIRKIRCRREIFLFKNIRSEISTLLIVTFVFAVFFLKYYFLR